MSSEYSSYQEYLCHPRFKAVRKTVLEAARYLCADCKRARATEVHHIKYPPWGEFDQPENLIPICHSCHCKRHGNEDELHSIFKNQGYSGITPVKQQQFRQIIETHLRCSYCIFRKHAAGGWIEGKYYYFDINAGAGRDVDGGAGSPLIFLEEASCVPMKYEVILIEKNKRRYNALLKNVEPYIGKPGINIVCHCGDHNGIIDKYLVAEKLARFGVCYADPNGKPSFGLLSKIAKTSCYSRLDILMNCSATAVKRSGPNNSITNGLTLDGYLQTINKHHWIVREPYGKQQWSFLLGTNWADFPSFEKIGMYRTRTLEGNQIFSKLNRTAKEEGDGYEISKDSRCLQSVI